MEPIDPRVHPDLVPEGSIPIIIAKGQEKDYIPIPSIVTPTSMVITRWRLTPLEREQLIAGEDVFLTIWGTPIRPVLLSVGELNWREM